MPSRQQVLSAALTTFNQQGAAFTLEQLADRLSLPPTSLSPYCNSKPELVQQLTSFILTKVRQPPCGVSYRSPTDELRVLFTTYSESFTAFNQTALFDLKLHYPEEWNRIMRPRESQWQKIAATLEAGAASGQLRLVNTRLFRMMVDAILLEPFLQEHLLLPELVDILLFGIIQRAP